MIIESKRKVKGPDTDWPTAVVEQGISQGTKYIEFLFNGATIMVGATQRNRNLQNVNWIGGGYYRSLGV
jgi:hypothetical protein